MAEELQIQDQLDQVDRILNEFMPCEQYLYQLDQVDRTLVEAQAGEHVYSGIHWVRKYSGLNVNYSVDSYAQAIHDIWTQERVSTVWVSSPRYLAAPLFARIEEESHSSTKNKDQEDVKKLREETSTLHKRILLLQAELRKNVPYLQLYRFGASAFSLSVLSLLSWLFTGIALPFHHVFALAVIPTSLGFILMAYLTHKYSPHDAELGNH